MANFFTLRLRLWDLLTASGAILTTTTVLAFGGSLWWFLDLFTHFRVQYFLGLSVLALVLLFPRRYRASGIFGLFALVNFCVIVPLYFGRESPPAAVSRPYRSLLMNVNSQSGRPDQVAQVIQLMAADILVLEEVKQAKSPVLLLGDLNITLWCSHFKRLLRASGLRDSSQGRGVLPTWPVDLPILLVPIDHCLHSAGIYITRKRTGPKVGSDHYPLMVDFVLTLPASQNR